MELLPLQLIYEKSVAVHTRTINNNVLQMVRTILQSAVEDILMSAVETTDIRELKHSTKTTAAVVYSNYEHDYRRLKLFNKH